MCFVEMILCVLCANGIAAAVLWYVLCLDLLSLTSLPPTLPPPSFLLFSPSPSSLWPPLLVTRRVLSTREVYLALYYKKYVYMHSYTRSRFFSPSPPRPTGHFPTYIAAEKAAAVAAGIH